MVTSEEFCDEHNHFRGQLRALVTSIQHKVTNRFLVMKKQSLWIDTSPLQDFPQLKGRMEVDAIVVGGGITGLTTAYLLKQVGLRVAVVDQRSIGGAETSHTTAHVTFVTDARLHELASRLGEKAAQAFWGAGQLAMRQIEDIVGELEVDCELKRVPGYLFAALGKDTQKEVESLKHDALLADTFGFDAVFVESDPLFKRPAVRFPNQLKFHPLKYVNAIATALPGEGCHVFSRTSGSEIHAGGTRLLPSGSSEGSPSHEPE
jgi:glycine/D-amino acid oxidase-like deaminating enzyme